MKSSGTTQIKEIAARLGISPGTVSIVLNGRGDAMRISKATQQRVKDAAKEMNYQPNLYARRLRNAGSETACKIVAVLWSSEFADDILSRFFKGLHETVKNKSYNVEFFIQLFDYDRLSDYKKIMSSSRFSGIIISGASDNDITFLHKTDFDLPIVLINQNEQKYHNVYTNDYEVGKSTARLLYTRKHKKVGLISMKRKVHGAILRQVGFLEACNQYGMEMRDEWIIEEKARDYVSGYHAMQQILKSKEQPTAIFVMSSNQVLGTIVACRDAGIVIPKDMEIITYGDSDTFKYFSPTVTSIHLPVECLAENALNLMVLILENGIEMPMSRMLCAEYAFRESCGEFLEED